MHVLSHSSGDNFVGVNNDRLQEDRGGSKGSSSFHPSLGNAMKSRCYNDIDISSLEIVTSSKKRKGSILKLLRFLPLNPLAGETRLAPRRELNHLVLISVRSNYAPGLNGPS